MPTFYAINSNLFARHTTRWRIRAIPAVARGVHNGSRRRRSSAKAVPVVPG